MGKTGLGEAGDEGRGKKLLGRWEREGRKEKGRRGETAMLPPREDSEGRKGTFTDTL